MKINGYVPPISGTSKSYLDPMKKMAQKGVGQAAGDCVELSSSKKLFAEAVEAAKNAPEVRVNLVAEIKERIANGTYQIDDRKTAEAILSNLR